MEDASLNFDAVLVK